MPRSLGGHLKTARPTPRPLHAGQYLIDDELARGGFGVVHRGRHALTGERAAVKILHAGFAGDAIARERFAREAGIVSALDHPSIVRVFEHGLLDDGRPFFAMELLEGTTLAARLASDGRMASEDALAILTPLSSALDAAHARGIVHRDVKPSNVFLAGERVVLLDFGVAKLRDVDAVALTGSKDTVGTLVYMAPEQILGSMVDARTDVYALGAVAYGMLTGEAPFGLSAGRLLRQIHKGARPKRPSEVAPIDPAFDAPVLRALSPVPEARHSSAGAFVAELAEAFEARRLRVQKAVVGRRAFAIYAEVRAPSMAMGDERPEAWLGDMEAALPTVSGALASHGLVPVIETATKMLLVEGDAHDPSRADGLAAASKQAYLSFLARRSAESPIDLAIVIHEAFLALSPEGTLMPEGLLDLASWVPAAPRGVMASNAVLALLGASSEPGFGWLLR